MYIHINLEALITHPCHNLTHRGRVTHTCVSKLTILASDNGLSPDRRQAIIWTNAGLLLIGSLGTNLSEILIEILTFSFKKMRLKVSSAKRRPFCLGLNELTGVLAGPPFELGMNQSYPTEYHEMLSFIHALILNKIYQQNRLMQFGRNIYLSSRVLPADKKVPVQIRTHTWISLPGHSRQVADSFIGFHIIENQRNTCTASINMACQGKQGTRRLISHIRH